MTLSPSIPPLCTRKLRPLFRLAASTAFILSASARTARATSTFAHFAQATTITRAGVGRHPCFLWNRKFDSRRKLNIMGSTPNPDILESPSAERNKGPIYDQILAPTVFPRLVKHANEDSRDKINVLELAAGCGVHTTHFVSSYLSANENEDLGMEWHPSDPDAEARLSTDARVKMANLESSVVPSNSWSLGKTGGTSCGGDSRDRGDAGPRDGENEGDIADYSGHHDHFDLALCINMIHIAPWEATLGLMGCAGKVLRKGGMLVCYGPYKVGGKAVESNLNFDKSLRSRNPEWGVRNLEDVIEVAKGEGLEFVESIEMPANNMGVLFCKV